MKRFLLAAALIFAFALPVFSQKANEPIGTLPDDGVATNKPDGEFSAQFSKANVHRRGGASGLLPLFE